MNIDQTRELLYDYVRGKLSPGERTVVEQQLSNSELLRKELKSVQMYYDALGSVESVSVPENFLERIHKRIDSKEQKSILSRVRFPSFLKLPVEIAGIVATAVLVVFLFIPQFEKKNFSEYETVLPSERCETTLPEKADKPEVSTYNNNGDVTSSTGITGKPSQSTSELPIENMTPPALSEVKPDAKVNTDHEEVRRKGAMAVNEQVKPRSFYSVKERAPVEAPQASAEVSDVSGLPSTPAVSGQQESQMQLESSRGSDVIPEPSPPPPASSSPAPARSMPVYESPSLQAAGESAAKSTVSDEQPKRKITSNRGNDPGREELLKKIRDLESKRARLNASPPVVSKGEPSRGYASDNSLLSAKEDIISLLIQCRMNWRVIDSVPGRKTYSAGGTVKSVELFLRKIKERSDVELVKTVPENYESAIDSVFVEFKVGRK